jgi:hypothetical protein
LSSDTLKVSSDFLVAQSEFLIFAKVSLSSSFNHTSFLQCGQSLLTSLCAITTLKEAGIKNGCIHI